MFTTTLERNHKSLDAVRPEARNPRPSTASEFIPFPQGNLGSGSVTLALIGWRPRHIRPDRSWQARLGRAVDAVGARLALWHERANSRAALLDLNDRSLNDIGLDRASAYRQGSLPFWRGE